jgi:cytochrome c oxidase assembly protein subunit 15
MNRNYRSIVIWLIIVCVMVFAMVMIGGITRLTDSGLSMVDWRPLVGAIPPLNEIEWLKVFNDYKSYPEYQKINHGMTLSEFKSIFFWEYFHRLWGRLIGLVFFLPFLYFWLRGYLSKQLKVKLVIALVLGGSQGVLGWYMVKSGLIDRPDVSHFRLAAHLGLAFLIIGYISWIIFGITNRDLIKESNSKVYKLLVAFSVLLCFQIIYGAFVAGLDAGVGYNTFPKMGRSWIPSAVLSYPSILQDFLENRVMIQFVHRVGGWLILIFSFIFMFQKRKVESKSHAKSLGLIVGMIYLQFALGVITIVYSIPLSAALLHQLGACILVILTVNAICKFKAVPNLDSSS